jgi:hypothetical protein
MRTRAFIIFLSVIAASAGLATIAAGTALTPVPPPDPAVPTGATEANTLPSELPLPVPEPPNTNEPASSVKLPCTNVDQGLNFPSYWAGRSFEGLALTAVLRRCDLVRADEYVRANYVSYIYGNCIAGDDEGCAPPIEVQSWPSVERDKRSLTPTPVESGVPGTDTTVGGVPATKYEDGHRLEIYRADTTVLVFGDDPAQVDRIAAALVRGPSVLTELAQFGIVFDTTCVDNPHYCVGEIRL